MKPTCNNCQRTVSHSLFSGLCPFCKITELKAELADKDDTIKHLKKKAEFDMPDSMRGHYYNACTDSCDMIDGPCACGAWHNAKEWITKLDKRLQQRNADLESVKSRSCTKRVTLLQQETIKKLRAKLAELRYIPGKGLPVEANNTLSKSHDGMVTIVHTDEIKQLKAELEELKETLLSVADDLRYITQKGRAGVPYWIANRGEVLVGKVDKALGKKG